MIAQVELYAVVRIHWEYGSKSVPYASPVSFLFLIVVFQVPVPSFQSSA